MLTRASFVVALLAAAGCAYRSFADCTVACTAASGCPDGLTCGREGFCRIAETTGASCATVLEDAGVRRRVTVAVNGGNGKVTSTPAGIDCPGACMFDFAAGTQVTLAALPGSGGAFTGWAGACSGTGTCTISVLADVEVSAAFACTGSQTFDLTGAPEVVALPACATSITVDARGGAGARGTNSGTASGTGGRGGRVQATFAVQPGDTFTVRVGGTGTGATAGFNGGAGAGNDTSQVGGGGGGASDLRRNGDALADRIVVAGGGGGAGVCGGSGFDGGAGGGLVGGGPVKCQTPSVVATGGTQSAGGAGGAYPTYCSASAGSLGVGAAGCSPSGGGGGGGGYYGGGGGAYHGGGGGSSFTSAAATAVTHSQGFETGDGQVIVSW